MRSVEKARVVVNMAKRSRGQEMRRQKGMRARVRAEDILMNTKSAYS